MTGDQLEPTDELEELVIGRALHALDEIERDVAEDPAVLEYHDVLSYLPFDEIAPPRTLEARVLRAARDARAPEVRSLAASRRYRRIAVVGAAAAVAAVVSFVVVNDANENGKGTQIASVSAARPRCLTLLAGVTDAPPVPLRDDAGVVVGRIALTSDGEGAYCTTQLPARAGHSYWLWLKDGNRAIVLGQPPTDAGSGFTFTVDGTVTGASISVEPGTSRPAAPGTIVATADL
jgi:hypothetical protein